MPTYHPSRGIPAYSFNLDAMPADGSYGLAVGIQRGSAEGPRDVNFFTAFDTPPTTINIEVHQSVDGVNFFPTGDTSSDPAGTMKTMRGVVSPLLKAYVVSSTGGSKITVGFTV